MTAHNLDQLIEAVVMLQEQSTRVADELAIILAQLRRIRAEHEKGSK
jgi:hypothetical protein